MPREVYYQMEWISLQSQAKYEQALQVARRFAEAAPRIAQSHLMLGISNYLLGNTQESLKIIQQHEKLSPEFTKLKCQILWDEGKFIESTKILEEVIQKKNDIVDQLSGEVVLAYRLAKQGILEDSKKHLKKVNDSLELLRHHPKFQQLSEYARLAEIHIMLLEGKEADAQQKVESMSFELRVPKEEVTNLKDYMKKRGLYRKFGGVPPSRPKSYFETLDALN